MAHATGVDPVILTGSLCGFLDRTIPALIAWTIERIAVRGVPHPVPRWRRGGPLTKERLARRGRGLGRCRSRYCRCLTHLSVFRLYSPHLIEPILKGFRPAQPNKHDHQKQLAEKAHNQASSLEPSFSGSRRDYNSKLTPPGIRGPHPVAAAVSATNEQGILHATRVPPQACGDYENLSSVHGSAVLL